ncbi:iron-siderophore ABC transporter substrate-binding protein [Chlorogloeopsis sp. ULAP01]|uniref:iron-siderophore ABC transporter substrate-binding protein n=1 Tax=Chlorogloeopsis sp. ULAP01 TaxID=3056483 RepID=UPI0025AB10DB|nr:iron-siderophore ABC transporter substrate-binding protein [Chlorogloeopsis sp. ULAP01]MDM9382304.1 iron-siderophore ABC transporter substrate-binding protein [Chlorogloeopsis sp. ULAP01]
MKLLPIFLSRKWQKRDEPEMCKKLYHVVLLSLLGTLIVFMVSACNNQTADTVTKFDSSFSTANCRVIKYAMGKTCVSINPQRTVVLGSLDYALSLGVKPIGSDGIDNKAYLKDKIAGIENIGAINAPSLEKILALKPDLILGGDFLDGSYSVLSSIAPTILIPFKHSGDWKQFFRRYAQVLGKTAESEQVMNDYYARLEEFKQQIGNQANQLKVSIVRVYPNQVSLYLKDSFCGTIVADAGLSRASSQNLNAEEAKTLFGTEIQYTISREKLQSADGDVIFLWSYGHQNAIAQQSQAQKEKLKADPLWSTLKAVQQNQVYEVPEYWFGDGPIAANAVIDDLFKYLVK